MSHDHLHPEPEDARKSASPTAPRPAPAALEDAGAQALAEALRSSFGIVKFLMLGLVAAFFISGVFTVKPNQVAILLRFGAVVGTGPDQLLQPGLHWKLPYPIDELVTVPVGETRMITSSTGWYGMTPEEAVAGEKSEENAPVSLQPGWDGYTLTGDRNIIHVRATLNYRISDPRAFAFGFVGYTNFLQSALDNALFHASARFHSDDALYRQRARFQEAVLARVTETVERLGLGAALDLREVRVDPPLSVKKAFTDVLDAQQKGDTRVREAEAYARNVTNSAIGEASVVVQTSLTMSNTLVEAVRTDATNFLGLLPSHARNPQLLKERLRTETVQRVLTNAQFKAFLSERPDGQSRELRILLSRELEAPTKTEAPAKQP